MRKPPFTFAVLYCFFLLAGSAYAESTLVYGMGEKTISLGSSASWDLMEKRQGVIEASNIRPYPVLVLADNDDADFLDLHMSFDEGRPNSFADAQGRYDVFVSPELAAVRAPQSRLGAGAALFTGGGFEPITLKPRYISSFAAGNHLRDFSIEFWVYPQNLENGERILSWNSSKPNGTGGSINQNIQCVSSKNKLQWTFANFFFSPGEEKQKTISFSGPMLVSRTWSHHLVRFDADLGLMEYLVDGKTEAIVYATSIDREGGDVYTPVIGNGGQFVLGSRFSGLIDNFCVYHCFLDKAQLTKYRSRGGRVESRTVDLGYANSKVLKIEAFGGRTANLPGSVRNEYAGSGALKFKDHSEMRFFIRVSNSAYRWNDVPWVPVNPGLELNKSFSGRYVQIAADFYPGEDGETSPYLSELKLVYMAAEPPAPPTLVTAVAKDGAVELSWRASTSKNVGGYMIYFGTAKGEYFGNHAYLKSPFDAGNNTSFLIEGLDNGTLYYFSVASYCKSDDIYFPAKMSLPEPGEFSMETAARPLRMAR